MNPEGQCVTFLVWRSTILRRFSCPLHGDAITFQETMVMYPESVLCEFWRDQLDVWSCSAIGREFVYILLIFNLTQIPCAVNEA